MSQIAVIGAGAWGTALSIVLGRKGGHRIRLWVYEKEVRESIAARRVNELFLPGQSIPDSESLQRQVGERGGRLTDREARVRPALEQDHIVA